MALSCLSAAASPFIPQQSGLDLAFVLDGSGSISSADFALQKSGLATAIQNTQLVPPTGDVAVTVIQFAGGTTRVEVGYTSITSQATASSVASSIAGIQQIGGGTNPGDGVVTATSVLNASGRPLATQAICLSTDGTPNGGVSLGSAVTQAQNSAIGIDVFGVIGIECPGIFGQAQLDSAYAPFVFGGGAAVLVGSSAEFANTVGPACFGEPLKVVGLEINQAVQDWANTVDLIEGKLTYVRAHVEPVDPMVQQTVATARLRGFRAGAELPGSPLQPINPGGQVVARQNAASRRGDWDSSLNFRLPQSWLTGTIQLEIEGIGANLDCQAAAALNMDCESSSLTFTSVDEPELRFIGLRYVDQAGNTVAAAPTSILNGRLQAVFPVDSVDATFGTLDITNESSPPTQDEILDRVERMRWTELCFDWLGCDRIYYGALRGEVVEGAAFCPGTEGYGYLPTGLARGYNTHAHEVAHSLGVDHAPFCGATSGGGTCTTFPVYFSSNGLATLGPMGQGDDALVYGLDTYVFPPRVVDPNRTFALMSYCSGLPPETRTWVSSPAYEAIAPVINNEFRLPAYSTSSLPSTGSNLIWLISGSIDTQAGTGSFEPLLKIPGPMPPAPPAGGYEFELVDAQGATLLGFSFEARTPTIDTASVHAPNADFGFQIPFDPLAERMIIRENGVVVTELAASLSPPVVTVTSPNGGEVLSGTVDVEWTAADPDGDALSYLVQYSSDAGASWETLAVDWEETSLAVNFDILSGSQTAVVRVVASDGFRCASDESDGFFVTDTAPEVTITSPGDGDRFFGVQSIFFTADAVDTEDGELGDGDVRWISSLDGRLGVGRELIVRVDQLTEGQHTIRCEGTDSASNVGADEITIETATIFIEDCTLVDFQTDDTGDLINGQVPVFGSAFTLTSRGFNAGPAIFDSSPTGPNAQSQDPDLLVGRGNLVVLQDPNSTATGGVFSEPNDSAVGGELRFDFIDPVRVETLDLVDICPGERALVTLIDSMGLQRQFEVPGGWTSDVSVSGVGFGILNVLTTIEQPGVTGTVTATEDPGFDEDEVLTLTVGYRGSGAMANLRFCTNS